VFNDVLVSKLRNRLASEVLSLSGLAATPPVSPDIIPDRTPDRPWPGL
jgi:hypothetical protein